MSQIVDQVNFEISQQHYEVVPRDKVLKTNIWKWTHTPKVCQSLFGCEWSELDLKWLEECKYSFAKIPKVDIRKRKDIKIEAQRISRTLYIPLNENYSVTSCFADKLIKNQCHRIPGLRAIAKAFNLLRELDVLPIRDNLIELIGKDAFYALYKAGFLRRIQLFGNRTNRFAYFYHEVLLQ